VNVLKAVTDHLADSRVLLDEVSKSKAPRAPIATHLTDDEMVCRLCLFYRFVYLNSSLKIQQ